MKIGLGTRATPSPKKNRLTKMGQLFLLYAKETKDILEEREGAFLANNRGLEWDRGAGQ